MTAPVSEIRVEDMPDVNDVLGCQSRFGCSRPAELKLVRCCCSEWMEHAKYPEFLCYKHYVRWIIKHSREYVCSFCHQHGRITAIAVYREI